VDASIFNLFVIWLALLAANLPFFNDIDNIFSQCWEFYVVTGYMFLVLAYPGYVLCYLKKHC